jgi:hypothetical protein
LSRQQGQVSQGLLGIHSWLLKIAQSHCRPAKVYLVIGAVILEILDYLYGLFVVVDNKGTLHMN